jgi:hypothetical protein
MPLPKGFKHSVETRIKMSASGRGKPKSTAHRATIAAGHRGRTALKRYHRLCACSKKFSSGAPNSKFCSVKCRRASRGHGLINAPEFAHFKKVCAICYSLEQLVGDHEHLTGKPRGILCRNCNLAIGNMFDKPHLLRGAATYLEER